MPQRQRVGAAQPLAQVRIAGGLEESGRRQDRGHARSRTRSRTRPPGAGRRTSHRGSVRRSPAPEGTGPRRSPRRGSSAGIRRRGTAGSTAPRSAAPAPCRSSKARSTAIRSRGYVTDTELCIQSAQTVCAVENAQAAAPAAAATSEKRRLRRKAYAATNAKLNLEKQDAGLDPGLRAEAGPGSQAKGDRNPLREVEGPHGSGGDPCVPEEALAGAAAIAPASSGPMRPGPREGGSRPRPLRRGPCATDAGRGRSRARRRLRR